MSPECEVCGEIANKVYECEVCGVLFCKDCGSIKDKICIECSSEEEEEEEEES